MLKPKLSTSMVIVGVLVGSVPIYYHTMNADEAVSLFKGMQLAMSGVISSIWLVGSLIVGVMEKSRVK